MEHQRNTNIYQTQPSSPPSPRIQSLIAEVLDSPPRSIDIDQSLSSSFSSLNLSPNNHADRATFVQYNQYPVIGSPIEREPVNYNNNVYACVDLNSYLLVNEFVYSTQHQITYDNTNNIMPNNNIDKKYGLVSNNIQSEPVLSRMSLQQLKRMICVLAKDQNGWKILRSKFENPTEEEIEIVLYEVVGSIADLMKDQFGNYIIQKLISVCNDDQKGLIVHKLTESSHKIVDVCMSPYGTRAVQLLLENLKSPHQIMRIIRALQPSVARLANDVNGHHVLRYCLFHFDNGVTQLIVDQIAGNCFNVATNRSGCCVMQACVEHFGGEARNRLVTEILANAIHIAEDPFGNYVLQHMLGLKSPRLTELVVRQLEGNFAHLSKNKYGSNVVEKCLIESRRDISTRIVLELVGSPNPASLLVDPYGNFVMQSALKVSEGFASKCLLKLISGNVTLMQSNLYGKKILETVERIRRNRAHVRY